MSLAGVRVLDLTRLLPGAVCTLALADMGADVIKVEEPGRGDYMRWMPPLVGEYSAYFNALCRNKRSLTLNLKAEAGRDLFLRLVETADVVVEGNRPGVMARLGLGWETLRERRPDLVMCSITGYGQDGPFAQRAGHDVNYMATAGALSLTGPPGGPPITPGLQIADIGGGAMGAAMAIMGALLEVARGGAGRHLDVSMTDGAVAWAAVPLAEAAALGRRPRRSGGRLTGGFPCYRVYECAGGGYVSVGALEPKFWSALCEALARPDLAPYGLAEGDDGERAHREMEAIFATRTRDEWAAALDGLDVCCEPVLELDEVAGHPQIAARGLIERRPTGVEVRPQVPPPPGWRRLDPPRLGEHNAEVLAELGVAEARLQELAAAGAV